MRYALHVVLALAAACGSAASPGDAGPECLRRDDAGLFNFEECGVCIRSHERMLGWAVREPVAVTVEDGLLVVARYSLQLVRRDGVVVSAPGIPRARSDEDVGTWPPRIVRVPGRRAVWVVVVRQPEFGTTTSRGTELILYEYDAEGFTRVAEGVIPEWLGQAPIAFPSGELFAEAADGIALNRRFGVVRATPEGGVELVEAVDFPPLYGKLAMDRMAWRVGDEIALILESADRRDYWLRIRSDLTVSAGPLAVTIPEDDRFYREPVVALALPGPSGEAALALVADLAGDPPRRRHIYVQRIGPDGTLAWDSPGILVNPDQYGDLSLAGLWEVDNIVGVAWSIYPQRWIQAVGPDGSLVLPASRLHSDYSLEDRRHVAGQIVMGGAAGVYGWATRMVTPNPGPPADARLDELMVDRIDVDGDFVWPEPTVVQQCTFEEGRIDGQHWLPIVGDQEDGVWLLYSDVPQAVDGRIYEMLKVTLVRSDGSFAW